MSSASPVNKYLLNMYTYPCYDNNDYTPTAVLGNDRAFLRIQIYICEPFIKAYPKKEWMDLGAARLHQKKQRCRSAVKAAYLQLIFMFHFLLSGNIQPPEQLLQQHWRKSGKAV